MFLQLLDANIYTRLWYGNHCYFRQILAIWKHEISLKRSTKRFQQANLSVMFPLTKPVLANMFNFYAHIESEPQAYDRTVETYMLVAVR